MLSMLFNVYILLYCIAVCQVFKTTIKLNEIFSLISEIKIIPP